MAKKSLWLDGVVGSQIKDTQGEILSVDGADISELEAGRGRWNDNHGSGFFNSIGRITEAKKILKKEDCDNDRHQYFWEKIKAPFIYAKGYLYDDEDHPNAKAASAILRNIHKADSPLKLKASVEGGVVTRGLKDPSILQRTKIHSVALTFTPANNATLIEPVNLDKSELSTESDMALIKSVMHLAQSNIPSFRQIEREASADKIVDNIKQISMKLEKMGLTSLEQPDKKELLVSALEDKIKANIELISASVNEKIEKGWKEAALGASMLAAPMSSVAQQEAAPTSQQTEVSKPSTVPSWHRQVLLNAAKKYPLLAAIAFKESSGAQNYNHDKITNPKSIHYGHTAGGMFAMMPNTAKEVLKSSGRLRKKYPTMWENSKDISSNHAKFTNLFNTNPSAALDFAIECHDQNRKNFGSDAEFALGWNRGWHGAKKLINSGFDPHQDEYVKSVLGDAKRDLASASNKNINKINSFGKMKNLVAKAVMAGYGAGSPFSFTGGSVMQSESLEGSPRLRYIRCNKCGKEQVHGKYQVKCRECNKNFDLSNLMAVLSKR
jgi:hypothetical protein